MDKGIIFDIKRYAIHDGPGIRTTVFLKGCSLRCEWCHNPEGVDTEPEIILRLSRCAKECSACIPACPQGAITKNRRSLEFDKEKCDLCGICEDICVYDALEIVGQKMTVQEVVDEIEKDRIFFEESGGGVTFSGGEPLMQLDFLEALLEEVKKRNIHVALDTSGNVSFEDLEKISNKVDLFLYDLKIMDDEKHEKYTGVSNKTILENLLKLSGGGTPVIVRIPLIAEVNDDDRSIQMIADYLLNLKSIKEVSLLPYHRGGCEKYKRLRKEKFMKSFEPPPDKRIKRVKKILADSGFSVKTGG